MSDNQGQEKGFNDDELADIMNEIESLEKDFEEVEAVEVKSEEQPVEEVPVEEPVAKEEPVVEAKGEPEPEVNLSSEEKEVFEELVEMPESKAVPHIAPAAKPEQEHEHVAEVKHMPTPAPTPEIPSGHPGHTAMSFKVEGEMKLSMSFWVSGKEFKVWVDENEGFVIQLDGGAEFKVPVHAPEKKVA